MYSKMTTVINPTGIHARPAAEFVRTAKKYNADITIQKDGSKTAVNAKSILSVLGQCLTQGSNVIISAEGDDEVTAVDSLVALIEAGFGE